MKGCRSLTDEEVDRVIKELRSKRDICLFTIGIKCGMRISEILSLTVANVTQHGVVADSVTLNKKNTKGQIESRIIPLTNTAKETIRNYLESIGTIQELDQKRALFKSEQSDRSITRVRAHRILKDAFNSLRFQGKCATHSLRKTFAQKAHKALGEKIELTQEALGHKSLSNTKKYIEVNQDVVRAAILGMG